MGKYIHKVGKFYSNIIVGNIGLFIFVGLFSILFQELGWFPNASVYAISQLVYDMIIPICISYAGGTQIGGSMGGVLSVLMTAGILYGDDTSVILAAMIAAPVGGWLWKRIEYLLKKYAASSMQMLVRNLLAGCVGGILAIGGYYIVAPVLALAGLGLSYGVEFFLSHHMAGLLCLFIEPAKILFLNNVINHGILIPLGMGLMQEVGSSVLFLLETNPGPGFGILAALFWIKKEKKETYAAAMVAQAVGGIHEVYFPEVLSNLRLLFPLMVSSAAGALWFDAAGVGATAPISPGSFITISLLTPVHDLWKVLGGILISAVVSFGISIWILKGKRKIEIQSNKEGELQESFLQIHQIGFICDAGVGSSAMGAALLRRKLQQEEIQGVLVEAYACDQIPEHLDLIVCQRDFQRLLPKWTEHREVFLMDNLLDRDALNILAEIIKRRNG